MDTYSVEIPRISFRNCAFFVYSATTYVAFGLWGSVAPQLVTQPQMADLTNSTVSISSKKYANEGISIGAADPDRAPNFFKLPGDADHLDLLLVTEQSDTTALYLSISSYYQW